MNRHDFRSAFGTNRQVTLPVIHVLDEPRTAANIEILMTVGAHGCFLINHDFRAAELVPIVRTIRMEFPSLWIGVNLLGVSAPDAFYMLADLQQTGCRVDGYWSDNAQIDHTVIEQERATAIDEARHLSGWNGLYFGGVAFKYQRTVPIESHRSVARVASRHMDIITTSGPGTGEPASPDKVIAFRDGAGDHPIAVASGITPENARAYREADCFIVATGINKPGNFYDIDEDRLKMLLRT